MNREDVLLLRKSYLCQRHIIHLDAAERDLARGQYFAAVSHVRAMLMDEYNRAQEYAKVGKIARESSLIQSSKDILERFEKAEAKKAGAALKGMALKAFAQSPKKIIGASFVFKALNVVLRSVGCVEVPQKFVDVACVAAAFCTKLITDKNCRQETIDAVKTWFRGGEKRKRVAEACAKIKEKTCGFWGWAKNAARGIFSRSENRQKLSVGH